MLWAEHGFAFRIFDLALLQGSAMLDTHRSKPALCPLCRLLRRLPRRCSPEFLGRRVLLGSLRVADGTDSGHSVCAEVGAVPVLRGPVCDALVDPSTVSISFPFIRRVSDKIGCLLAGGGVGSVDDGDEVLRGLVGVARLLSQDSNAAVLSGHDTDSLDPLELEGFGMRMMRLRLIYLRVGVPGMLDPLVS